MELCYYSQEVYWVVSFSSPEYTILDASGTAVDHAQVEFLGPMLEQCSTCGAFVDIWQEARALERAAAVEVEILAALMLEGGTGRLSEAIDGLSEWEIDSGVKRLAEKRWVKTDDSGCISLPTPGSSLEETGVLAEILRFALETGVCADVLGCQFFDSCIDQLMMRHVESIQSGLPLVGIEDRVSEILRLSPSALCFALKPDPGIVNHRRNTKLPVMDDFDRNNFLRRLGLLLSQDFGNKDLHGYFFERRSLREIETHQTLVVKNAEKVQLDLTVDQRLALGKWHAGGHILVSVVPGQPQPWEAGGIGHR